MAVYPQGLTIGNDSKRLPRGGRVIDDDGDGYSRVRKMHADRYDFAIVHPGLQATDQATFLAFYNARATDNASFTFYWIDGVPYTVVFDEPPWDENPLGAGSTTYRVRLRAAEA